MMILRIIPGVLWLDVLDKVTDTCQSVTVGDGGWRWPCGIVVLVVWMSILGEIRLQAVRAVRHVTVVYYRPHRHRIHHWYGQWQVRLFLCAALCAASYYVTFEFADDFPYLQTLKESIQNEQHNRRIAKAEHDLDDDDDADDRKQQVFLMAHIYVQRFLQQIDSIVWILGTFLRLHRKRFIGWLTLVLMLRPLSSFLVSWCGNFSLWIFIGHHLMRAFDLTPSSHPRLGQVGCYSAVVASTMFWRKYGTMEILVALVAAIGGELTWQRTVTNVQEQHKNRQQEGKRPGILDRVWGYVTNFFIAPEDDDEEDDGEHSSTKKDDDNKKGVNYTTPPLYAWMAIAVYWAAVGIHLDGYDLFTTF